MTHPTDEKRLGEVEDWVGCDLENATAFEVLRTYNGIVVKSRHDFSRDTATPVIQSLVFQNPAHFIDWLQHWLETTKSTRSTR